MLGNLGDSDKIPIFVARHHSRLLGARMAREWTLGACSAREGQDTYKGFPRGCGRLAREADRASAA